MTDIAGRTAFLTGAANGIGLGIARSLADAGAKLALIDIDAEALERARAELAAKTSVMAEVLDMRDREGFARVADKIEDELGPVSLVINNAGVSAGAPVDKLTYELWDWGLGINLDGVVSGVQTFLPRMIERGQGGHIVNTASVAGLAASENGVLYITAKYGVVGMSEALHAELKPFGIGASVLCPGPVTTGILERTRTMQPKFDKLDPARRAAAVEHMVGIARTLEGGRHPDDVGHLVVRAIERDDLFILTDGYCEIPVKERTRNILAAIPAL